MNIKFNKRLFLINKNGNITDNLIVASNFENKQDLEDYKKKHDLKCYSFKNKTGKNKLYVGDKISFLTAKNVYKV